MPKLSWSQSFNKSNIPRNVHAFTSPNREYEFITVTFDNDTAFHVFEIAFDEKNPMKVSLKEIQSVSCETSPLLINSSEDNLFVVLSDGTLLSYTLSNAKTAPIGEHTYTAPFDASVVPIALTVSADGKSVVVAEQDGSVVVLDADTLETRALIPDAEGVCPNAVAMPDTGRLVVAGMGGICKLYTVEGTLIAVAHVDEYDPVNAMCVSPLAPEAIAIGCGSGNVAVIDASRMEGGFILEPSGLPIKVLGIIPDEAQGSPIACITADPRSASTFVYATLSGVVCSLNARTGQVSLLRDTSVPANSVAVTHHGLIVVASEDGCIQIGVE
ncbi:hypothetical protein J8273_1683 [Carpediemonas membranifera]|uniref:Uncharacterized protein n=1 Tax=Carpediemonas membranifera TaxID=201153 RepID=A0A8J6B0G7_9EUKA|nr:hypothetical protein J8273_1683 [Carpediemonas membranifera]|eukprot:KAG9396665.1 hypothetical protein J8273_1683 [Carpediemonas membranifera]